MSPGRRALEALLLLACLSVLAAALLGLAELAVRLVEAGRSMVEP